MTKHVVIIGNGVAGTSAARHIRKKSDYQITIISEETKYFYSRTALMYIYMGHMKFEDTKPYEDWFWEKNRIDLVQSRVTSVDFEGNSLQLQNEQKMNYDYLVLATGSKSNKFGWPGQDLNGVQGLYHYHDLQMMENATKDCKQAVIVGGGLIGIEMAEMLHSRDIPVTMLVREPKFWTGVLPSGEADFIGSHIKSHHINVLYNTELKEIIGDENQHAKAVVTSTGERIETTFVGLTAGVHPNTQLVKDTPIECGRGILVDDLLKTNFENVFAVGDCAEVRQPIPGRRPIEPLWYTGKMMGETIASTICGKPKKYDPGIWYNSAKFLDIEYQTYGVVLPKPPEGQESFFWEDRTKNVCVRVNFEKNFGKFIGINLFGIRGRHKVFEKWLANQANIQEVMEDLRKANFDPEFFKQHEKPILQAFNTQYKTNYSLRSKKGLFGIFKK